LELREDSGAEELEVNRLAEEVGLVGGNQVQQSRELGSPGIAGDQIVIRLKLGVPQFAEALRQAGDQQGLLAGWKEDPALPVHEGAELPELLLGDPVITHGRALRRLARFGEPPRTFGARESREQHQGDAGTGRQEGLIIQDLRKRVLVDGEVRSVCGRAGRHGAEDHDSQDQQRPTFHERQYSRKMEIDKTMMEEIGLLY